MADDIADLDYTFAKTVELLNLQVKNLDYSEFEKSMTVQFSFEFEKEGKIEVWQKMKFGKLE